MTLPGNRGELADVQSSSQNNWNDYNGVECHMDHLSGYARRPFAFVLRYLRRRLASHLVILAAVVAAVA
jgi:ATP-binding cassette, subfamily B, bacterial